MKKLNLFFLSFLAFAFIACEDDEAVLDTEKPTITISGPPNNTEFYADEEVVLEATVSDELGLEKVEVWVTPPGATTGQLVYSEPVSDFLNDNTEAEIEEPVDLSSSGEPSPGTYKIEVQATDEAGQIARESISVVILEADNEAPMTTVHAPVVGDVYQLGGDLQLDAMVEDNEVLEEVLVQIMSDAEGGTVIHDSTYTEFADPTTFDITETFEIPETANTGAYTLVITPTDMAGNEGEAEEVTFRVEAP